jgi:hypothetical protein
MQALVASGDPAEALEHARQHAARMEAELEAAPSEAVVAYAEALRRNPPVTHTAASPPWPPSSPPRADIGLVMPAPPSYTLLGRRPARWEPHRGTRLNWSHPDPRRALDRDSRLPTPSAFTLPAEKPSGRVFLAGLVLAALLLLVIYLWRR